MDYISRYTGEEIDARLGMAGDSPFVPGGGEPSAQMREGGASATGKYAVAEGADNVNGGQPGEGEEKLFALAEGYAAHAEGAGYAKGDYSHAEGGGNEVVEGKQTRPTATGKYSHAEGTHTHAADHCAHAEGNGTLAKYAAHAEGLNTEATGDESHAEGKDTKATDERAHAEGEGTTAGNKCAHSEGLRTQAMHTGAHSEGIDTESSWMGAHSEGVRTKATQAGSHSEGADTEANGNRAHSEGDHTQANGSFSHSEGEGTRANHRAEHACGQFNVSRDGDTDETRTIFSIGIGSGDNERMNALEVLKSGAMFLKGVGFDGVNLGAQSLQEYLTPGEVQNITKASSVTGGIFTVRKLIGKLAVLTIAGTTIANTVTGTSKVIGTVPIGLRPSASFRTVVQISANDAWRALCTIAANGEITIKCLGKDNGTAQPVGGAVIWANIIYNFE